MTTKKAKIKIPHRFKQIIGLAGVAENENASAQKFSRRFSYVVLAALVAVIIQLITDVSEVTDLDFEFSFAIWLIFTIEFSVSLYLVNDKKRYIISNWLNLMIIILTTPWIVFGGNWAAIFRALRLLLFIKVFEQIFADVIVVLNRNRFGMVLLVAAIFIVISGGIFSSIENTSFKTGLWYALVTVTTVGYGDVVPHTEPGRMFGTLLIILGVVLFSLVTANISAFLVGAEQKKIERDILHLVQSMEINLEKQNLDQDKYTNKMIQNLTEQMKELEERMTQSRKNHLQEQLFALEQKRLKENEALQEHVIAGQQEILALMAKLKANEPQNSKIEE